VETPFVFGGTPGAEPIVKPPDASGQVLASEREIIYSQDIALEAARHVGAERILPPKVGHAPSLDQAAGYILKNLKVDTPNRSEVISLRFQHGNPAVAQDVLTNFVDAYLTKHEQIHQGGGGIGTEKLVREAEQLRHDLATTEQMLQREKAAGGVVSVEEAKKFNIQQKAQISQELITAESELAGARASLGVLANASPETNGLGTLAIRPAPPAAVDEYRDICDRVDLLTRQGAELGLKYTPASPLVQTNQIQLTLARARKLQLETNYPSLVRTSTVAPVNVVGPVNDPIAQLAKIRVWEAKIRVWTNKLDELRIEAANLDQVERNVGDYTRKKLELEAQLRQLDKTLEQRRSRAALGGDRAPNISIVQAPTPAYRDLAQLYKKMGMTAFGGFAAGLALAFIIEMVFNRSLKRPKDVESALNLPLFVTIPALQLTSPFQGKSNQAQIGNGSNGSTEASAALMRRKQDDPAMAAASPDHALRPYHEALRDQLINYFEVREMTHKPKMIAVTSCDDGAGVSSTAAGLAASLSETGDGNVLLVDMRGGQGTSHTFFNGKPVCGIEEALESESRGNTQVHDHLFVVATDTEEKPQRILPRQFGDMVPKLKASDFDYIIFDMPPVAQTSITSKVARFMDMVLMVVESEKTDREVAKRARALLAESKATVATVLNKRKQYVPKWLLQEFH
ncbi:MAG TPA: hypothetical protein VNH84_09085, partial [Candidatus Saccharimonadales bacterium]|nr:hypothetical protein [Candidatus Saccharimonadales bacterium]